MNYRYVKKKLVIDKGDGIYFSLTGKQLDELEEMIKVIRRVEEARRRLSCK